MFPYKEKLMKWTEEKKTNEIRIFIETLPKNEKGNVFEFYVAELYRGNGWLAIRKGGKGDKGADVLIYHPKTPNEVAFIIQAKNQKQPLSFDDTVSELNKFEKEASKLYDCKHYMLISINGFVKDARKLQEFNMRLETWKHIESLIETFSPNGKLVPEIELYAHNKIAYENVIRKWKDSDKVAVVQATGTGKSFIIIKALADFIDEKKIVLAPSNIILDEIKKNALWLESSTEFMTYAKLMNLSKDEIEKIKPSLIILDEFHRVGAELWGMGVSKLLENNPEVKVLGTTATPVRYLDGSRDMVEELFDKNAATELSLQRAIVKGILPNPKYISALHTLDEEIEIINEKISKSKNSEKEKEEMLNKIKAFSVSWGKSHGIPEILRNHIQQNESKFIIFCKDKEHLEEMESWVEIWFKKAKFGKKIKRYRVISGESPSKEELKEFQNAKKEKHIHLLFSIDMLNEGLHVKGIDGVVLLRPTESPIVFYQQIGRTIATGNQKQPLIFDFVNNFNQIRSVDFINDLNKEKGIENKKRKKMGLNLNDIKFNIYDETKEFYLMIKNIEKYLQINWDFMYSKLIKYKEENGDCLVPKDYINDPQLARWVFTQRTLYKKKKLLKERIEKLNEIDFVWDYDEFYWNLMYLKLIEYKNQHGDCLVIRDEDNKLRNWVSIQRTYYKRNKLQKEKIEKLNKIDFVWDVLEYIWNKMYDKLKNYKIKYGDCLVPDKWEGDKELGIWVGSRRQDYKNGKLSEEKIKQLEEVGFVWEPHEKTWEDMYEQLIEYKKQFGDCNVNRSFENSKLVSWVLIQRKQYKEGVLSSNKIEKLNEVGFEWVIVDKEKENKNWNEMFELLQEYKNTYNDCDVPSIEPHKELYKWVIRQRSGYRSKKLSHWKMEKLNEIEFLWSVEEYRWNKMFDCLKIYKIKYGDCLFNDQYEDKKLVNWVYAQRTKYRKNKLAQEEIKKLNDLGFIWEPGEELWEYMYQKLVEYQKENGRCNVPKEYKKEPKLYSWVSERRKDYKRKRLSEERIEKLNKIGFFLES